MKEIKDIKIIDQTLRKTVKESINDNLSMNEKIERLMIPKRNLVVIETKNKENGKIIDKQENHNLVVYHGRSWVAQRVLNKSLYTEGDRTNYPNMFISWFALGSGGCDTSNPLDVNPVKLVEYSLSNHEKIAEDNEIGENNLSVTIDSTVFHYHSLSNITFFPDPDIIPGDNIGISDPDYELMEDIDIEGYKADSYLCVLIEVNITESEYNGPSYYGLSGVAYKDLNEAGLFFSLSDTPDPNLTGIPQLYAKVNFSTIRKTENRELVFRWYLYF